MQNTLYLNAAKCKKTKRPPIWLMRQAGRYLPEYQEIRKSYSFMEMMKNPELASEITLQPIKRFGMDAAILFSDILVTAESLGSKLDYIDGKGPVIYNPIKDIKDIEYLDVKNSNEKLTHIFEEIKLLKKELINYKTPLIGFAGAPFTVATYMIEGGSSKTFEKTKSFIKTNPDLFQKLLKKLSTVTIAYLNKQIESGVDAIQIFDSWASLLSLDNFKKYCLFYIQEIIKNLNNPNSIPITIFCRNMKNFYPLLINSGANVISIDQDANLADIKKKIPNNIAVQGNLDPKLLLAPKDMLEKETLSLLNKLKNETGYIFNLGHGVTPQTKPDNVKLVVDLVKSFSNG